MSKQRPMRADLSPLSYAAIHATEPGDLSQWLGNVMIAPETVS